ncbi:MAG: hypothetical protein BWY52_02344 [Chloroflexi bacterium ADurb.Bin325]|nr:MAG: hypothetical protein BWY52_02344 [Chloroflexi bacterium ADurb.Bin325]
MPDSRSRPLPRWSAPAALALVTALAAFLRCWQLDTIPPGFHYDEAYEALEAWRVLTQPGYHPIFFAGNFGVEPMFIYLAAIAFRLFGAAPVVMRGVGAAVGIVTVPALYLLAREWVQLDRRLPPALPLFAALALAIQRWHITFSRMAIEPILVPLFLVLLLWAFARGLRTGSRWAWACFGLAAGLGPYTYPAGRLLPALAALLGVAALVRAAADIRHPERSPHAVRTQPKDAARSEAQPKDAALTSAPSTGPSSSAASSRTTRSGCFVSFMGNLRRHPERSEAQPKDAALTSAPSTGLSSSATSRRTTRSGCSVSFMGNLRRHPERSEAQSKDAARSRRGGHFQSSEARPAPPPAGAFGAVLGGLLLAGAIALLVFAPLAVNFARHPDQLLLRSSQIAVTPGAEDAAGPLHNLVAALGMFSVRGDADPRSNLPGLPVLDVLMSIPFMIGVVWLAWRGRRLTAALWWLAFAVMLVPTVFSDYAPHFRRGLGLAPLVALASGLGLAVILGRADSHPATAPAAVPPLLQRSGASAEQIAADMDRLRYVGRAVVVGVIVVGSLVYSATAYLGTWGRSPVLYYAYDQGLWEIGQYVLGLPAEERVYVSPRPASDMTLAFAWRAGRPVRHFDGRHAFVASEQADATYIIIEYEDFRGWRLLDELYPDRREVRRFLDRTGQVYARAYRVARGQPLARGPRNPVDADAAHWPGFALLGYDIDRASYRPGEIVYLQLWWRADAAIETDWTVFTHLLGPTRADGGIVWAGQDARPGQGSAGMTTWAAGDLVLDEYQWQLPADAPPGEYRIEVGVYDPARGGQRGTTADGQDHVVIGTLRIER